MRTQIFVSTRFLTTFAALSSEALSTATRVTARAVRAQTVILTDWRIDVTFVDIYKQR